MLNKEFFYNQKKGQVGETITWVIATIIVGVLLMFFIFSSTLLGTGKNIIGYKDSLFSKTYTLDEDIFLKKSIYTLLTTKGESDFRQVDKSLKKLEEQDQFKLDYNQTMEDILKKYNKK